MASLSRDVHYSRRFLDVTPTAPEWKSVPWPLVAAILGISVLAGCAALSLESALRKGDTQQALSMVERGKQPNRRFLSTAAAFGNTAVVRRLLEKGADPNSRVAGLEFPLVMAAQRRDVEIARLLISHGANVNTGDCWDNNPPLIHATLAGSPQIIELLLDAGAGIDVRDSQSPSFVAYAGHIPGFTPLMLAAHYGGKEVARVLLDRGADTDIRNNQERTALQEAESTGHPELARMIRNAKPIGQRKAALAIKKRREQARAGRPDGATPSQAADLEKRALDAAGSGRREEALRLYTAALNDAAGDPAAEQRLSEKILLTARSLPASPPIPDEAQRHMVRGMLLAKEAKDYEGYAAAIGEIEDAIRNAPWWALAYFNLGLAQDSSGQFDDAVRSFKLYLVGAPEAPDALQVKRKIYELELKAEQSR